MAVAPDAVARISSAMASDRPAQGTPAGCFDTCWGAAHDLAHALRRGGVGCRVVLLRGWRGAIGIPETGNHREWLRTGPAAWTHWVVRTEDGTFVDPTARQFDAGLGHPQIDDETSIRRRWDIVDGDDRRVRAPTTF